MNETHLTNNDKKKERKKEKKPSPNHPHNCKNNKLKPETTNYQIGFKHGREARAQVSRCIAFYASLFRETAKLDWDGVRRIAKDEYEPVLQKKWPAYLEEMRGSPPCLCPLWLPLPLSLRHSITKTPQVWQKAQTPISRPSSLSTSARK